MLLGKALDRKPGVVYPEKNREEAAAMLEAQELKQELFRRLAAEGAAQMGVADLRGLVPSGLETGVAVLVSLPRDLVRALQTAPTRAYYAAYHTLNAQLDRIVTRGADFLEQAGYRAWAQTTSAVVQDAGWSTPLPHKTVATRAGLGWVGKSCLLVTRAYGSAVRLSSLVTDAPPALGPAGGGEPVQGLLPLRPALPWPGPHRGHLAPRPAPGGPAAEGDLPGDPAAPDEDRHRHRHRPVRPVLCRLPPHPAVPAGAGRGQGAYAIEESWKCKKFAVSIRRLTIVSDRLGLGLWASPPGGQGDKRYCVSAG